MKRIALGTAQLAAPYGIPPRRVSMEDAREIIALAQKNSIDTIDTALEYGEGETILGSLGMRGFEVITKIPEAPHGKIDAWLPQKVKESLARLKVDGLRGLLLHRPGQLLSDEGEDLYRSLLKTREKGLTQKIGISVYSPEELDAILGRFEFDLIQLPMSIMDRRFERSGWLDRLKERGMEIHGRSIFLQGLLLMDETPERFDSWNSHFEEWKSWRTKSGISALEACVSFALSFSQIDRVVVGCQSASQLAAILRCANHPSPFPTFRIEDEDLLDPRRWRPA